MKKFIALFLVFSLLALSGNLFAKERRGAELIVQKKDGQQVRGELIAVKQNSLLLLESESGADVSIDIADIKAIRIVYKSKAGWGFLAGGALGALLVLATYKEPKGWITFSPSLVAGVGAALGALLGVAIGISIGTDEIIQIEGKSDSEIREVLEKLRKKARVRNFK